MTRQAADKARKSARRCTCTHRRDAHVSRLVPPPDDRPGERDHIVHWCRECDTPCTFTPDQPKPATTPACSHPHKQPYPNAHAAGRAADLLRAKASGSGLAVEVFECRAGHWHVGTPTRVRKRPKKRT